MILNIETSEQACSAALSHEGALMYQLSETEPMRHSEKLAPFVDALLKEMRKRDEKLDAVAVSIGPGSYTGLRIGLSTAKGVCVALGVPLITVPTLEAWAVKIMFADHTLEGDEILMPMMDARRMEVYCAAYDFALKEVLAPCPVILDADSFNQFMPGRKIVIAGSGACKVKDAYRRGEIMKGLEGRVIFPEVGDNLFAGDMIALSEKYMREGRFADTAYSVPLYIKEYQATRAKNRVLEEARNANN